MWAHDGAKVLLVDADLRERALSSKVSHLASSEPSRIGARPAATARPAHSDLTTIIRTAWAWHMKTHPLKADASVHD